MSVSEIAQALGVTYAEASNNVKELVKEGVAQEMLETYPKLILFPGVKEVMRVE